MLIDKALGEKMKENGKQTVRQREREREREMRRGVELSYPQLADWSAIGYWVKM